jgi:hypothetical protein
MVFETILQSDLQKMVNVKQLTGNLFSADNGGNKITVEILDGGAPATVSGSVYGYAIREDGKTVVIEGTLSGNKASIVLPASAYAVIGKLNIVIKVGTATVGACQAYVYRTTTDAIVDPGSVVPDISELLAQIGACEEATTAANTAATAANTAAANVGGNLAANYSTSAAYAVGDYCIKDGTLYRCTTAITSGENWNSAHWTAAKIGPDVSALKSALYDEIITCFPDAMKADTCKYSNITGMTLEDGYRLGSLNGKITKISATGYTLWTIPVSSNEIIRFSNTYFGKNDGEYRSFFVGSDGETIIQKIDDTGADASSTFVYLRVPFGSSYYLAVSNTSIKSSAVIQVLEYDSIANKTLLSNKATELITDINQSSQVNYSRTFVSGTITPSTFTPVVNAQYMHSEVLYAVNDLDVQFDGTKYWVNISTCTAIDGSGYIESTWKYDDFTVSKGTYFWLVVRGITAHDFTEAEQADIQSNVIVANKNGFAGNIRELYSKAGNSGIEIANIKNDIGESYITKTPYQAYQSGEYTIDDTGKITLTYKGIRTANFTPKTDEKCEVRFAYSTTASTVDFRVYIFGTNGYLVTSDVIATASGKKTYTFDPNEAYVYHEASSFYVILLNNMTEETVEITDFVIVQNKMIGQDNYKDGVWDTIAEVNSDVMQNKTDIANMSNAETSVINPSGEKFYLTIDGSGNLKPVRAIPLKALFMGNSLLFGNGNSGKTPGVDPDSNFFGMCASNNELDYFHYITAYLTSLNGGFTPSKLYFSPFEHATSAQDISDYITNKLTPKLSSDLDLISIQGGDNVTSANEPYFYSGMETLIQTIRTNCPNARISWMAEWFLGADLDEVTAICKKYGVKLILIHDLNITANQGYIGQVITNPDGTTVTVSNAAVAAHPGDVGMRLIANRYLYQMGIAPTDSTYTGS